jgi:hypothetical protein
MTDYQLKRRAIANFRNFDVPKHVQRNYQKQWIQCVRRLGDNWLYAQALKKGAVYVGL